LAGQIASALAGARAYEAERERAAALAEAVRLRQEAAEALRLANRTLAAEVERRTQESARLRDLFRQAPGFIAVLREPAHIFELTNDSYRQLVGHRDLTGKPVREALPEVVEQGFVQLLDSVYQSGEAYVGRRMPVTLQRTREGPAELRYVDFVYQPIVGEDGKVDGIFVEGFDSTESQKAEEHQRLLLNELNHRVRNTLAIVQAIAQQSFKDEHASAEARSSFDGRLSALSAAHNLLTRSNWEAASMRQLIEDAIAPYRGEGRFEIAGPDLHVPPKTAVSLALALHELATNAVKYGALSVPDGRVAIRWSVNPDPAGDRLAFSWREQGGPPVTVPTSRGFGSRMIERGLAAEFGGTVRIAFDPDGVCCTIDAPLPEAIL
jgi:two-component sensor histidine kinase/PAS domain-containing protein